MEDRRKSDERARQWLGRLAQRDPELFGALSSQLNASEADMDIRPEGTGSRPDSSGVRMETIVQTGRPALFIVKNAIQPDTPLRDPASRLMVERVMAASDALTPWMPLIGRIDVENHPAGFGYVGTGWLIQPGLVCTNRHVAELIGQRDGRRFTFQRGRFGKVLGVSINRGHEYGEASSSDDAMAISDIAWIEPPDGHDVALLRVTMPEDGTRPGFIPLADDDSAPGAFIATIGYPARAYEDAIPDQRWMDEIYGGIYDVKRIAPGQLDSLETAHTTYDCTTLGGASGSPVFDLKSGKVIALHFAGLYMVENYGVPVRVLRRYLAGVPQLTTETRPVDVQVGGAGGSPPTGTVLSAVAASDGGVTIAVPLTISISLGQPVVAGQSAMSLVDAMAALAAERRDGVLAVKPGFDGRSDVIVLSVDPAKYDMIATATPSTYAGHPVDVRYATIAEQLGLPTLHTEAPTGIAYDDNRRRGAAFSFSEVDEDMTVIAHVGPESSFPIFKDFIGKARKTLTSAMYQFFAGHIADAVAERLKANVRMRIVLDPATRDPQSGAAKEGEFDRSETFKHWRDNHQFENIYVRKRGGGLVNTAYHIKVTVRDGEWVWLSSGNWTRSSQPEPVAGRAKGNREWHIVIRSPALSTMFAAHIEADFAQSEEMEQTPEAPAVAEQFVDVPDEVFTEAPVQMIPPLEIPNRRVRVKPVLTPDRRGRIYTDAVLDLIRSARHQLVFQNQYINIGRGMTGNLADLVDALVDRSKSIKDVRIILRSGDVADSVTELRRRGMDVMRCVRVVSNTHTKGIVVDGERVLIGSQNWSSDAVTVNRDASLLFDDDEIARYFLGAFEIDWARARPAAGTRDERPVLPAGAGAPPPGYTRMPLSEYLNG